MKNLKKFVQAEHLSRELDEFQQDIEVVVLDWICNYSYYISERYWKHHQVIETTHNLILQNKQYEILMWIIKHGKNTRYDGVYYKHYKTNDTEDQNPSYESRAYVYYFMECFNKLVSKKEELKEDNIYFLDFFYNLLNGISKEEFRSQVIRKCRINWEAIRYKRTDLFEWMMDKFEVIDVMDSFLQIYHLIVRWHEMSAIKNNMLVMLTQHHNVKKAYLDFKSVYVANGVVHTCRHAIRRLLEHMIDKSYLDDMEWWYDNNLPIEGIFDNFYTYCKEKESDDIILWALEKNLCSYDWGSSHIRYIVHSYMELYFMEKFQKEIERFTGNLDELEFQTYSLIRNRETLEKIIKLAVQKATPLTNNLAIATAINTDINGSQYTRDDFLKLIDSWNGKKLSYRNVFIEKKGEIKNRGRWKTRYEWYETKTDQDFTLDPETYQTLKSLIFST